MATIIDALVVTLGLDNSDYKKKSKESEAEQNKFRDQTKKNGYDISSTLLRVGKAASALFLGFESVKGAINLFAGLTVQNANLGRFAANVGQSAHEINTWGMAVELAGGSAADAQADVQNLQSSITALKSTGEVSPLLLLFQRLGVAIYDAQGKTRILVDIYKDAGDKLKAYNRADAAALARGAGISDSTLNLILAEGKERDRLLALAEKNNQVNQQSIKDAEKLQEEWREIKQGISGAANEFERFAAPAVLSSFKWLSENGTGVKDFFIGLASVLTLVFLPAIVAATVAAAPLLAAIIAIGAGAAAVGFVIHKLGEKGSTNVSGEKLGRSPGRGNFKTAPVGAASPHHNSDNNNPGDLRYAGQAGATRGANGFAAFPTMQAGIVAANRQLDLYAKRGVNTIASIVSKWAPVSENDTSGYIAQVEKQLGKGRNAQLTAADRQKLLQAIFKREGVNKVSSGDIASALGPNANAAAVASFATNQTPTGASTGGGSRSSSTSVSIDSITVHTQATDADGVAAALPGALKRKGVVSQADTGMT